MDSVFITSKIDLHFAKGHLTHFGIEKNERKFFVWYMILYTDSVLFYIFAYAKLDNDLPDKFILLGECSLS